MLCSVPRHGLVWVTMLTWRKEHRLYFRLGVKDALPAQEALTWFLRIEPLNTVQSAEFARSSLSNFFPLNLTTDAICRITFPPWPQLTTEWQTRVGMFAQGKDILRSQVYQTERKAAIQPGTHGQTMG